MATKTRKGVDKELDSNPDPITGAPGSHPVGTGLGAAGAGAAGAAIGATIGTGLILGIWMTGSSEAQKAWALMKSIAPR